MNPKQLKEYSLKEEMTNKGVRKRSVHQYALLGDTETKKRAIRKIKCCLNDNSFRDKEARNELRTLLILLETEVEE